MGVRRYFRRWGQAQKAPTMGEKVAKSHQYSKKNCFLIFQGGRRPTLAPPPPPTAGAHVLYCIVFNLINILTKWAKNIIITWTIAHCKYIHYTITACDILS